MAIRIIRSWSTIIINVEKANKKIDGGLVAFLSGYYPPKEKTFFEKVKGLFSSPKTMTLDDFDNMNFSSGMRVLGGNGGDGKLYFMSSSKKADTDSCVKVLESYGLISNKKGIDCDFYIYDDSVETAKPCKWLQLLMKETPASKECMVSSYSYFSISPFSMPSTLKGERQGDISYDTQYVWEQYQKMVSAVNPKGMKDLSDIQIRHLNARLWDKEIPGVNVFVKAYLEKNTSKIAPKYRHILDGSKDTLDSKQNIITYNTAPAPVKTEAKVKSTVLPTSIVQKKSVVPKPVESSKPSVTSKQQKSLDISGKYFRVDQIVSKNIGSSVCLKPIDAGIVFNEFKELDTIPILAKDANDFKKFLPGMDLSTSESAKSFFNSFITLTELGQKFGYTIRMQGLVCGFIFINTPDYNNTTIGFKEWTIDFATFPMFQRQHIMIGVLPHVLAFLKNDLHVDSLYAIVHHENTKCINLISKICFDDTGRTLTSPQDGSVANLYECPLSTINFQRR